MHASSNTYSLILSCVDDIYSSIPSRELNGTSLDLLVEMCEPTNKFFEMTKLVITLIRLFLFNEIIRHFAPFFIFNEDYNLGSFLHHIHYVNIRVY